MTAFPPWRYNDGGICQISEGATASRSGRRKVRPVKRNLTTMRRPVRSSLVFQASLRPNSPFPAPASALRAGVFLRVAPRHVLPDDAPLARPSRGAETAPLAMSRIKYTSPSALCNLRSRRERDRSGLFFVEGLRFVSQAFEHHASVQTLITVPKMLTHPYAQALLRRAARAHVPVLEVTPEVFLGQSRAEEPQWIGAIIPQRWDRLASVMPGDGLCWLAYDTVHSPGNLGTIIRTGDAVGAAGLILIGSDVDPYDPATVRATMGALFAQRLVRVTPAEFDAWRHKHGVQLVGTSPHAACDFQSVRYPRPLVLWMGGERQGLSPEQQSQCDLMVRLPMVGSSDSLNLAVATGVMLYELFHQQREALRHLTP